jgi:hypothetical protein
MIDWVRAINNRLLVSFEYDDFERVVMPVAFGLNSHTGNELVRAYQVGGGDAKRAIPAWSMFRADRVIGGRVLDERFGADPPGYRRGDRAMDVVYAQL